MSGVKKECGQEGNHGRAFGTLLKVCGNSLEQTSNYSFNLKLRDHVVVYIQGHTL